MTDATTHDRLIVNSESRAWPYLWVPLVQIEKLKELFDRRHYVEDFSLSRNNGPEIVKINFGRDTDPDVIQNILDQEQ